MSNGEFVEDGFINMDENYDEYVKYLRLLFTEYYENVHLMDTIMEDNVFNSKTYVELTGIVNLMKKRIFPQLFAFFSMDELFEDDIYPEFMDIHLMVLYMFDKLRYELDEVLLHYDYNNPIIDEELIDLENINYLLKMIYPQLSLFAKVFDLKIQVVEGSIDEMEFEKRMIEVHDSIFNEDM